jgi:hypothetical protein
LGRQRIITLPALILKFGEGLFYLGLEAYAVEGIDDAGRDVSQMGVDPL